MGMVRRMLYRRMKINSFCLTIHVKYDILIDRQMGIE